MAKRGKKLDDDSLLAIIASRKSSGLNYQDGELATRRENSLSRYLGKLYGTEINGQSSVVTRQVLEAVEWTLPSLLKVFMSSPTIAEFSPVGPQDEEQSAQETLVINDALFRKNDGFMTIAAWIKATLMEPNSYIKVYWDEKETTETEEYEGLTYQEVSMILSQDNIKPLEQEVRQITVDTPLGPQPLEIVDLKVRKTITTGKPVVELVPPEELIIDDKLATVSLEDADFVCHTTHMTRSDLINLGFSEKVVYALPANPEMLSETSLRKQNTAGYGSSLGNTSATDESMDLIEVNETYLWIDYDGDGVAEFRRVLSVEGEVLDNEEAVSLPFVAMSAVPIPHSHVGLSWAELVEDVQKIYTTLTRQLLNNMYRTNNPRTVVGQGVSMDDILNDTSNGVIRAKNIANLRTEPITPIIGQVLPAFEMLDKMKEARTGVSRTTMGLDADALSRVAKGAFLGSLEQANQRLEALARIMAESGIKPLMLKLHKLIKTNQTEEYDMKVSGQWQKITPANWQDRDDMVITVGLGSGNKQAQMEALNHVMQAQGSLLQSPMGPMLINAQNLYNASAKMIEVTGLHSPERYFRDPSKIPPEEMQQIQQQQSQQQPDPLAEAQMEMAKVEREKVQLKAQTDQAELQLKAQTEQQKMQAQIYSLQAQLRKYNQDARLKRRELDIKEGDIMLKSELEQTKLDRANLSELEAAQREFETSMRENNDFTS